MIERQASLPLPHTRGLRLRHSRFRIPCSCSWVHEEVAPRNISNPFHVLLLHVTSLSIPIAPPPRLSRPSQYATLVGGCRQYENIPRSFWVSRLMHSPTLVVVSGRLAGSAFVLELLSQDQDSHFTSSEHSLSFFIALISQTHSHFLDSTASSIDRYPYPLHDNNQIRNRCVSFLSLSLQQLDPVAYKCVNTTVSLAAFSESLYQA